VPLPIRIGKEEESASAHHQGLPTCRSAVQQRRALHNDGLWPPPSSARHSLASSAAVLARGKNLCPAPSITRHTIFLQCKWRRTLLCPPSSARHLSSSSAVVPCTMTGPQVPLATTRHSLASSAAVRVHNSGLTPMKQDCASGHHPAVLANLSSSSAALHTVGPIGSEEDSASTHLGVLAN